MGVAWASGINLYAAMVMLGLLGATGNMDLPSGLQILANPVIIGAAGFMYVLEFIADKMPGVDTTWDTLHTFIRIPAGALLAAGAVGDVNPVVALAAAIAGTALHHPWVFIILLLGFILLMIWLLPKLWQGIRKLFGFIGRLWGHGKGSQPMHQDP